MVYRQFVKMTNGSPVLQSVSNNPIIHAQLVAQGWEPLGWEMPKAEPEAKPVEKEAKPNKRASSFGAAV